MFDVFLLLKARKKNRFLVFYKYFSYFEGTLEFFSLLKFFLCKMMNLNNLNSNNNNRTRFNGRARNSYANNISNNRRRGVVVEENTLLLDRQVEPSSNLLLDDYLNANNSNNNSGSSRLCNLYNTLANHHTLVHHQQHLAHNCHGDSQSQAATRFDDDCDGLLLGSPTHLAHNRPSLSYNHAYLQTLRKINNSSFYTNNFNLIRNNSFSLDNLDYNNNNSSGGENNYNRSSSCNQLNTSGNSCSLNNLYRTQEIHKHLRELKNISQPPNHHHHRHHIEHHQHQPSEHELVEVKIVKHSAEDVYDHDEEEEEANNVEPATPELTVKYKNQRHVSNNRQSLTNNNNNNNSKNLGKKNLINNKNQQPKSINDNCARKANTTSKTKTYHRDCAKSKANPPSNNNNNNNTSYNNEAYKNPRALHYSNSNKTIRVLKLASENSPNKSINLETTNFAGNNNNNNGNDNNGIAEATSLDLNSISNRNRYSNCDLFLNSTRAKQTKNQVPLSEMASASLLDNFYLDDFEVPISNNFHNNNASSFNILNGNSTNSHPNLTSNSFNNKTYATNNRQQISNSNRKIPQLLKPISQTQLPAQKAPVNRTSITKSKATNNSNSYSINYNNNLNNTRRPTFNSKIPTKKMNNTQRNNFMSNDELNSNNYNSNNNNNNNNLNSNSNFDVSNYYNNNNNGAYNMFNNPNNSESNNNYNSGNFNNGNFNNGNFNNNSNSNFAYSNNNNNNYPQPQSQFSSTNVPPSSHIGDQYNAQQLQQQYIQNNQVPPTARFTQQLNYKPPTNDHFKPTTSMNDISRLQNYTPINFDDFNEPINRGDSRPPSDGPNPLDLISQTPILVLNSMSNKDIYSSHDNNANRTRPHPRRLPKIVDFDPMDNDPSSLLNQGRTTSMKAVGALKNPNINEYLYSLSKKENLKSNCKIRNQFFIHFFLLLFTILNSNPMETTLKIEIFFIIN